MRPIEIWRFLRDPTTGWGPKLALLLAVAYAIFPVDLIPDLIPIIGWLDDLGIASAALAWVARAVQRHATEREARLRRAETALESGGALQAGPGNAGQSG